MKFAIIGAAGYIAPKHMEAIRHVGGDLVCALDPHDNVGILDRYFPDCKYFREFERFDRFCEKLKNDGDGIDYVSICSPNYLHDAHCRFALRIGANAICEKPLVLTTKNLDEMLLGESTYNKRINCILQLRLHPGIQTIEIQQGIRNKVYIQYYTPRGDWYHYSWKGINEKSGGLHTNIGIHLFDILIHLFGDVVRYNINHYTNYDVIGDMELANADVTFHLSINKSLPPKKEFKVNGECVDLLTGFSDLHNKSYENIINGGGYGIRDVYKAIELCEMIRKEPLMSYRGK